MFATIASFIEEWERESQMTCNLMDVLTDESLSQRIDTDRRTLGELAWHLASSLQFMNSLGLTFKGAGDYEDVQQSAAKIAAVYRRISADFLTAVRTQWTEANLDDSVSIMGEPWKNGDSMRFALMHQAHHRGQMTVLMRQAGLRPPGLYGPTYEAWIEQGMAPRA